MPLPHHPISGTGHSTSPKAFSLGETLIALALLGVIAFLALPNFWEMRSESSLRTAVARAESLNMAMASMVQAQGPAEASHEWNASPSAQERFIKLSPYLRAQENELSRYLPRGYTVTFNSIEPLKKVTLKQGAKVIAY